MHPLVTVLLFLSTLPCWCPPGHHGFAGRSGVLFGRLCWRKVFSCSSPVCFCFGLGALVPLFSCSLFFCVLRVQLTVPCTLFGVSLSSRFTDSVYEARSAAVFAFVSLSSHSVRCSSAHSLVLSSGVQQKHWSESRVAVSGLLSR